MAGLISLVMTVYNRERYLSAAIASVLAQTYPDFELLVWDDGSTDCSAAIGRAFADYDSRVRFVAADHQGRGIALQQAIGQTRGTYLGLVDSDDLLAPTALEETRAALEAHPTAGFVYTDYQVIDEQGVVTGYGKRCQIPYSPEGLLHQFMTFHFRLIRRSTLDQVGGINPAYDSAEDYELCLRLCEAAEVYHLKRPLYYYRYHRESISQQRQADQRRLSYQAAAAARFRRRPAPLPATPRRKSPVPSPLGLGLAAIPLIGLGGVDRAIAQVVPASDGTGTIVTPNGNQLSVTGGTVSRDGANLFHSFTRFGVRPEEIVDFKASPALRNILTRVTGGEASVIDGRIQVTGGAANLYLLNPAGIIFGSNASLNVPASFTATTAGAIGFGNGWFTVTGANNYTDLIGAPTGFAFGQAGAIVNQANLTVPQGNLSLLGGTVVSTGSLAAPNGSLLVAAVPGSSLVRLSQPGSPLSLEIQPSSNVSSGNGAPLSLAQLLTGGNVGNASGLEINASGQVMLSGSGLTVAPGDVAVSNATAANMLLRADRNLTLPPGRLQTTGAMNLLAGNTVQVRDSLTTPFVAQAGGSLLIQGNQGIDILALNHLNTSTPFVSGGNLSLISDGVISGDAHFQSGGNLAILNRAGQGGNFVSLHDPVFTVAGNFIQPGGTYTGASLKVQAGGDITFTGDITINAIDTTTIPATDPDFTTLTTSRALILRSTGGNIATGNITTTNINDSGGPIILAAPGTITTGNLNATSVISAATGTPINGSSVNINAGSTLTIGNIDTSTVTTGGGFSAASTPARGGNVTLNSGGNLTTGNISTTFNGNGPYGSEAGSITLTATGSMTTGSISAASINNATFLGLGTGTTSQGGNVLLSTIGAGPAFGRNITFTSISTQGQATSPFLGPVGLNATSGTVQVLANGTVQGTGGGTTINTTPFVQTPSAGIATSGAVTIQHDGGPNNLPLTIGAASGNGLAGIITTGTSALTSFSSPVLPNGGTDPTVPAGNITLRSTNTPPTIPPLTLTGAQQNQPFTFTYATLAALAGNPALASDGNSDNLLPIRIASVAAGASLTVNGTPIVPGTTVIQPGDTLVYTPPTNATGLLNAFTLQASDRAATAVGPVSINVAPVISGGGGGGSGGGGGGGNPSTPSGVSPCVFTNCNSLSGVPNPGPVPPAYLNPTDPEAAFTQRFSQVFGLPEPDVRTIAEQQALLQQIEHDTGAKPAFIYVSFIPADLGTPSSQTKQMLKLEGVPKRDTDQLELLLITGKGNPIRKRLANAPRSQVMLTSRQFRTEVSDPRKTRTTSYLPSAQQLYRWMVAPLEADLQARGINNLVFLLDDGLRSLPLAAFHDGKQFLVERYSLGLMPSVTLTDNRYRDIRKAQVLGVGISQSTQNQPPLPAVQVEVSTLVGQLWPGQILFNEKASLDNLKAMRQRQPFGIIHLATHADFRPGAPGNSYIQLWDDKLRLDQVHQLGWNKPQVDLLVLSACATALGDPDAELGFAGLAIQTGVKTAVASLWYVSDAATTGLMTRFYAELQTASFKAKAMQQAQIAMLQGQVSLDSNQLVGVIPGKTVPLPVSVSQGRDRRFVHPYYWAAFTVVGNPW